MTPLMLVLHDYKLVFRKLERKVSRNLEGLFVAVEIRSMQDIAQSAMQSVRAQRLRRKKYRYYKGYQELDITVRGDALHLDTCVAHDVQAISVLHGRNIVDSLTPLSSKVVKVNERELHQVHAEIPLAPLLDQWHDYRESLAGLATTEEADLDPTDVEDDDVELGDAEVEEAEDNDVVLEDNLYSGTVRLALSFTVDFDALPLGIAWLQLTEDGELLRRKIVREQLNAGELVLDGPVIAHRILGRFPSTRVSQELLYESQERSVGLYINKKAEVALAINRPLRFRHRIRTDITQVHGGTLSLGGVLDTQSDRLSSVTLQLVGRKSQFAVRTPVKLSFDEDLASKRFGRAIYNWSASLDFASFDWSEVDRGDNYDLYLLVSSQAGGEPSRLRVTRTPFAVRSTTRAGAITVGEKTLAISPYFTFKAKSTSLILEVFDKEAFAVLKDAHQRSFPIDQPSDAKPIWIIGELSYKAQDNALHLFKYLRNERPDIDAYYVIDQNAPDLRNFESMDHVVFHGSKEHFELAIRAQRFVGTHHADYLYPTRHHSFSSRCRATRVFLQHGVMGTKWMVPNYGKNAPGFATDLFMVSSEREKQYIVNDFLYSPDEVKVTGLSRFDALLAPEPATNENLLLIIPTWRDWLQNEEVFLESEYLEQWKNLLNSVELKRLVDKHDLEVVFCLHPNMMQFRDHFAGAPARLIVQGEVDVQELIKTAAVMVTDYSSVNFDFSFLHKPVHYYQFDRARFLGRNGSHLNLDEELPGRIAFDSETLLADLSDTLDRGKVMEEQYRQRADVFLTHQDQNNSRRVTAEIEAAQLRSKPSSGWRAELPVRLKNKFRRHKRYFEIMEKAFKLYKLAPMDEDLIIFESGLGRQYGDSPRYIYEELVRQGDTRRKVWVYSGKHRFTDPLTTTVKRLSPEYFWHLARANYWVNNQNFPHYLQRRTKGVFLQTWHGTPLKQMALDVREVHGRDEGYLERVTRATRQWTHLISPSRYTSDVMRSAYAFSGEAVELGYPRNDILTGEDAEQIEQRVRDELAISAGIKTVLYAPTFRDDASSSRGKFRFDLPMDLEEFDRRFGEDTILMLRMHVLVSNAVSIPESLRHRIIDVSSHPDIQELYLASDVLITDYSSVFFDYSLLRRPIIFYAYDLENYRDNLRGFYLDYESALPGPIVEEEHELWDVLAAALAGNDLPGVDREEFIRKFAPHDDGNAARRVIERFFK
ncbi:CDP-glycerol glycerophosphotransferase family protein [Glutamicibacter sp. JC586]|uniref:CDP-glycerol glycerophosphotransferase family protein n=1 Tax=Glutamicibacter sp. JC586 TaxID=2590552 RepID=UPI0013580AAF|nr:CDP-glycerol glycerophosphotransferase family protein [Glutamicibacter sp. JC586]